MDGWFLVFAVGEEPRLVETAERMSPVVAAGFGLIDRDGSV
jgi:hypothetical protein